MKPKKVKEITDDMIGNADRVCICASTVADIIISQAKGKNKKASLKDVVNRLKNKAPRQKK